VLLAAASEVAAEEAGTAAPDAARGAGAARVAFCSGQGPFQYDARALGGVLEAAVASEL
jgi:hypothetical protein